MSDLLFTVLIDTYNYGQYVEDAINSVLAQDYPRENYEILVVDDGSTDDTSDRMPKYGEAIRYLRKENGGQASAFNYGFERARGKIIALLDADDVWLPNKLQRVAEEFQKHAEAGMAYHPVYLWDGHEETEQDPNFVEVSGRITANRANLLKYPMSPSSCLAFRKEVLEKLRPIPEALRSQADAYLTALVIFLEPVQAIPEYLAKYRIHGANQFAQTGNEKSSQRTEHRMEMRSKLVEGIENWLQKNGHSLKTRETRAYLKQWEKAQEADAFQLRSPGRWEYARHLYEFPRIYGENMTGRHKLYSYLRAVGALFLGYHHLHVLDDIRAKYR